MREIVGFLLCFLVVILLFSLLDGKEIGWSFDGQHHTFSLIGITDKKK